MKKIWSPRVMQPFYKEWALERSGKLLGKVRYAISTVQPYTAEIYTPRGKSVVVYRGDNESAARQSVMASTA